MSVSAVIERVRRFLDVRIWSPGVGEAQKGRALLYRAVRIVYSTVKGFRAKRLTFRAAALTYYSILAIVPFLAFTFSVLKGFGGYKHLVEGTLQPYVQKTFGENPSLLRGIEQVLSFVNQTDASGLGVLGALLLAYTSISLLSTVETSLNDIWEAKSSRPVLRQVTDYTTLLVVTPLLVAAAVSFGTAAFNSHVVVYLRDTWALGTVIQWMLKLTSLVLGCVAMIALYIIMPNVRTRLSSALIGGLVGGLLWQAALVLQVKAQVGVANYNKLYSGFGAIPIFLVWIYISWLIVLIGAQLAASHQYEQNMRQAVRAQNVDQELREMLAIAICAEATRRFVDGCSPRTPIKLADLFEVPPPAVDDVLGALVRANVLSRAVCGQELGYLPARDIDAMRVSDVRDAVRSQSEAEELKRAVESKLNVRLCDLLHEQVEAAKNDRGNVTLRELAELLPRTRVFEAEDAQPRKPERLDAKQPGVPS